MFPYLEVLGVYYCVVFLTHDNNRSSRSQMFFKIGVLKSFAHFTGKHGCWNLFLIKLQTWRCFPVKFGNFSLIIKRQRCIWDPVKNIWWNILRKHWRAKRFSNFLRCTKRCLSLKIFKATVSKSADLKIYLLKKHFDGALVYEISSTIPTSKGNNMDFHSLH